MEYNWSTFSNLELSRLLNNGAGVEVLDTNFKRAFLGEVARRIESAARLEAELTAARAAAGIDAGTPLDEWIKAEIENHAEMTRRRYEARDAHDRGAILALFDHHDGDHHKWNSMTDFSCQARAQYAELISSIKEATKQIEIDGGLMRESEALIDQLKSEIAYLRSTDHAADLAFERAQKIGATYVIDETPLGQLLDGQGDEVTQ